MLCKYQLVSCSTFSPISVFSTCQSRNSCIAFVVKIKYVIIFKPSFWNQSLHCLFRPRDQPHYEVPNENQKIIEKWATEGLERLT